MKEVLETLGAHLTACNGLTPFYNWKRSARIINCKHYVSPGCAYRAILRNAHRQNRFINNIFFFMMLHRSFFVMMRTEHFYGILRSHCFFFRFMIKEWTFNWQPGEEGYKKGKNPKNARKIHSFLQGTKVAPVVTWHILKGLNMFYFTFCCFLIWCISFSLWLYLLRTSLIPCRRIDENYLPIFHNVFKLDCSHKMLLYSCQ